MTPASAASRTLGWNATVADLRAEASYLSRRLNQPLVRTPGAAGVLNRLAPSAVWVHGPVDADALLAELRDWRPTPEVMLPEQRSGVADTLSARGWDTEHIVERLRRDLSRDFRAVPGREVAIRTATADDMARLQALHLEVFGTTAFLPTEILEVPLLRLLVAELPGRPEQPLGTAGVRLRHQGALTFGLATPAEHRRCGIATALVQSCLEWAAKQRAPFALAEVDVPAPGLWSRLGFNSTGRWRRCTPPSSDNF
jgi:GNAT superfamily N-acetyltransferase